MTAVQTMTATATGTILAAENVHFAYDLSAPVLSGFTASLVPGRITVLLGPNAAGKTTLLRLLLGQLQPLRGGVRLMDKPISDWSAAARAAVLSYVPQRSSVSFAFTVEQVVSLGRFALSRDSRAIDDAIAQCDLGSLKHRVFSELSMGQQQRVLLARALAQSRGHGKIMLLDEPVSAMDLRHIHETMSTLAALASQGMAVLVVLHDLNLAARYADDVWLLDAGSLVRQGTCHDVLQPEVLEPIYGVRLRRLADEDRPILIAEV